MNEKKDDRLLKIIQDQIKSSGPLPIPIFTTLCLSHPVLGYYARRRPNSADPFGAKGDFVTSPEISQVFGEMLAVWLVSRWSAAGSPKKTRIVELGPGRGTLMADMIRTFSSIKSFAPTLGSVHLVENSEFMKDLQKQKLVEEMKLPELECRVEWWDRVEDVPPSEDEWTMVVAHEFFDALPVHIFQRTPEGFRELLVDIAATPTSPLVSSTPPEPLRMVLSRHPTLASQVLLPTSPSPSTPPQPSPQVDRLTSVPIGSKVEVSPMSVAVAESLGKLVGEGTVGGAGLVVDYGSDRWFSNSFRGFRRHEIVDPLSTPGQTDVTANVDFASLKLALSQHVKTQGPLSQRDFLTRMGLQIRLDQLQQKAKSEERKKGMQLAAERLVSGVGMGREYQVLGFESRGKGKEGEVYPFGES